jgi:hypothetical protein
MPAPLCRSVIAGIARHEIDVVALEAAQEAMLRALDQDHGMRDALAHAVCAYQKVEAARKAGRVA